MSPEALIFPISHFLKDLTHSAVGNLQFLADFRFCAFGTQPIVHYDAPVFQ